MIRSVCIGVTVILIAVTRPCGAYDIDSVRERYCEFQAELQKTYTQPVFLKYRIETEYTPAFFLVLYDAGFIAPRQTFNPPMADLMARLTARGEPFKTNGVQPLPFERDLMRRGLQRRCRAQLVYDPVTHDFHGETEEPFNSLLNRSLPLKCGTLGNPNVLVTHFVDIRSDADGRLIQTPRYEVFHALPASEINPGTESAPLERRRFYDFVASHTDGLAEAMMMLDGTQSDGLAEPPTGDGVPFQREVDERNDLVCVIWKRGNHETAERYETLFQPGEPWLPVEIQYEGHGYRQTCAYHYDRNAEGLLYFKGYDIHVAWAEANNAIVIRERLTVDSFAAPLELPRNMFTVAKNPEESVFFPMPKPIGIRHGTFAKAFVVINGLVFGIIIWLMWTGRRKSSHKKHKDSSADGD